MAGYPSRSSLSTTFAVADQRVSSDVVTICRIPCFIQLATWNTEAKHSHSIQASHPARDIGRKWPPCGHGPLFDIMGISQTWPSCQEEDRSIPLFDLARICDTSGNSQPDSYWNWLDPLNICTETGSSCFAHVISCQGAVTSLKLCHRRDKRSVKFKRVLGCCIN